jgi:hypothetical protein
LVTGLEVVMSEMETPEIDAVAKPDSDLVEVNELELVLEDEDEAEDEEGEQVLVVDVEKRQSRKKVKKLRQGRGPLMDKVYDVLDELRAGGVIEDQVQPVVFVVREKRR